MEIELAKSNKVKNNGGPTHYTIMLAVHFLQKYLKTYCLIILFILCGDIVMNRMKLV